MTNETKIQKMMFEALQSKYIAEQLDGEASLMVYFTSPVGIGEHPQHIEEMDRLVEKISNAKEKLEIIREFYKYN